MKGHIKTMNTANDLIINRGEVFYITSKYNTVGSEQRSGRPAVVVSNNLNNEHSECIEICYLTLQDKKPLPTHIKVDRGQCINSTILCEQITTISRSVLATLYANFLMTLWTQLIKHLLSL